MTALCLPFAMAFGLWAGRGGRGYLALLLGLESALMLLFSARDLVLFYVGFEAMLLPLALLIAIWGGEGASRRPCASSSTRSSARC